MICQTCDHTNGDAVDCSVCKLDFLKEKQKQQKKKKAESLDDDDYSISKELTENKQENTILVLFICAVAIVLFVILFSWLFR